MLTQCPNPTCAYQFEVEDRRAGKNGPCPSCGQVITFRSLDILRKIERERDRQASVGRHFKTAAPLGEASTGFMALLEDVRSLWNVGAIFRTADGAGLSRLILCGITGCPPRKEISKTSLGAEDSVPWEYAANAVEVLPSLKVQGVQIVALEKTTGSGTLASALARNLLKPPLCLVVGNEVSGVSAEALSHCDLACHLPMRGIKTSLNVAVAFGIAAYATAETVFR